jgi:hypothetical protein
MTRQNEIVAESVVSDAPTDVEHPQLYVNTGWELGAIALVCIVVIGVLAGLGRNVDAVVTGLVAIAASAVQGLVRLMEPRQG